MDGSQTQLQLVTRPVGKEIQNHCLLGLTISSVDPSKRTQETKQICHGATRERTNSHTPTNRPESIFEFPKRNSGVSSAETAPRCNHLPGFPTIRSSRAVGPSGSPTQWPTGASSLAAPELRLARKISQEFLASMKIMVDPIWMMTMLW